MQQRAAAALQFVNSKGEQRVLDNKHRAYPVPLCGNLQTEVIIPCAGRFSKCIITFNSENKNGTYARTAFLSSVVPQGEWMID